MKSVEEIKTELENFIVKTKNWKESCAVISESLEEVEMLERLLVDQGFNILEDVLDIGKRLEKEGNSIAIPVYRLKEKERQIYELALGYATGQIIINIEVDNLSGVQRFNSTNKNNSLILILTDDFVSNSNFNWLSIIGLTFRINN